MLLGMLLLGGCGLSFEDVPPLDDDPDPFEETALNFLVIGDWGRNGWFRQDEVAVQMGRVAEAVGSRFVISTGDNFYEDGVASLRDRQWDRSFEQVYTAPALHTPWYVVLGNHDYLGSVRAQVDYTERSDRWTLPARYYAVEHAVDDTSTALFVFLDTNTLLQTHEARYALGAEVTRRAEVQWRWLDSTLAATTADWRIVVGHHQVFSAPAGHSDPPLLRERLHPLLLRHGVDAYFSGHVHALQHLDPDSTVQYFISGGGSVGHRVAVPNDALFAAGVPGFMAVSLTPATLHVRVIGARGNVGYAASIERRKKVPRRTALPTAAPS